MNLRQFMDDYEAGLLPFDQLSAALETVTITQRPAGESLVEVYRQAESPPGNDDLFWLNSALNRGVLTSEQYEHLVQNRRRSRS